MKATLKPKASYEVAIDGVPIGTFEKRESWNGMLELRHASSGEKIIVTDSDDVLLILQFMNPEATRDAGVIMLSPQITEVVKTALTPNATSGNTDGG